ncbi:MAG: hypothetical protein AB1449_05850 [Chloroflexota bacterium]
MYLRWQGLRMEAQVKEPEGERVCLAAGHSGRLEFLLEGVSQPLQNAEFFIGHEQLDA